MSSSASTSSVSSSSVSSSSSSGSPSRESSPVRRTLALEDDDVRFEGNDPNWPFKPPADSLLLQHGQADPGEFDWDNIHDNEDLDIVLIRAPATVKAKHLEGAEVHIGGGRVHGEVELKKQIYSIGSTDNLPTDGVPHGDDMNGLKIMLPRRTAGGQLFLATKEVGAPLILTGVPPKPSSQNNKGTPNPERPYYSLQMLSHCYVPFGVKRGTPSEVLKMRVDSVGLGGDNKSKAKKTMPAANASEGKEKSKKRKKESTQDESNAPKKSKRAKQGV